MPQADKMMLLYRDVVDDPSGIQVFRRMEDVNEERLQQRQQRLETEGHEGAAEDGIELTQRCV